MRYIRTKMNITHIIEANFNINKFKPKNKTTRYTFNVELLVLNLSSGVPFFSNPLLVEQVAEKGVGVKDKASRGFLLPLMLMGERAFLNGLCSTASLDSTVTLASIKLYSTDISYHIKGATRHM